MRRSILVAVISGSFSAALLSPADAHNTTWYWSTTLAESSLGDRYSGIVYTSCQGVGRSVRTRSGKRGYKHHDCYVEFDDGTSDSGMLHVTGSQNFRFYWRN
jgi:hypothetical protein